MKGIVCLIAASALLYAGAAFCLTDINTASQSELEDLPGIGPSYAIKIIEGRPYRSVEDLRRVKGIGPKTLDKFKDRITVGSSRAPQREEAEAPKQAREERAKVPVYSTERFTLVECHSCTNKFTVSHELATGWCPYCDTRWRLRVAPAPPSSQAAAAPETGPAPEAGAGGGSVTDAIPFSEASQYIGQRKTVAGTIVGTHLSGRSGNLYLNFHQDYGRFLSVKIPAASVSRFPADAQNYYKGKEIIATGEISTEGAAHYLRLTVTDPADFRVLE